MASSKTDQTKEGGSTAEPKGGSAAKSEREKGAAAPKGDGGDRNIRLGEDADRLFKIAAGVGVTAMAVSLWLGFTGDSNVFLHSYTVAFMWILAITLGGLWWVTLQHLVGASWSIVARRVGEL